MPPRCGTPKDVASARYLAEHNGLEGRYQFQYWILGVVDAQISNDQKKGADGGSDGVIYAWDSPNAKKPFKINISVKNSAHRIGVALETGPGGDNNIANNLEWCTPSYNTSYGTARQRVMETLRKNKSWNKPPKAVELVQNGNVVATYHSINEAARETGHNACTICGQCKGNRSKRPGYQWRYAEETNI